MKGGRKKDCAGDRRLAKSKMAAVTADDAAARLRFSRVRIGMVELLCWHFDEHAFTSSSGCVDGFEIGWISVAGNHTSESIALFAVFRSNILGLLQHDGPTGRRWAGLQSHLQTLILPSMLIRREDC